MEFEGITKVTQILERANGSEVRITANLMFGFGLTSSVDVFVHRRDGPRHDWHLCNDKPHPDWRKMSVDEYANQGRSEKLQTASHCEILKLVAMLGKPMPLEDNDENAEITGQDNPKSRGPHP